MKLLVTLGGCLLLIVPAGCVYIPVAETQALSGQRIASEQTAFITPGVTHRADIVRGLGEPYAEFPDLRIIAYKWEMREGIFVWVVPGGYNTTGGAFDVGNPYVLLIAFDTDDRVVKFETKSQSPWDSVREHALKWAEGEGLAIPKPPAKFVARAIPSGESILYLYRQGGFWDRPDIVPSPAVQVNGKFVGGLRKGEYLAVALSPGANTITVDSIPLQSMKSVSRSPTVTSIDVQTLPGEAYYVMVRVPHGFGVSTPVLTARSEQEALPVLENMKPAP